MNRGRHGGMLTGVLALLLVMVVGVFTWATIVNSRRLGGLSCHPGDIDWWTMSSPAPAPEGMHAQTLIEDAKRLASQAQDKLWGPGGLIERCEAWWQGQQAKRPEAGAPAANADRMRYEQRFAEADTAFRSGLDAYKRAGPSARGSSAEKRAAALEAHSHFQRAHDLLAASLPPYEALGEHDPARAKSAQQLLDYADQLLAMSTGG